MLSIIFFLTIMADDSLKNVPLADFSSQGLPAAITKDGVTFFPTIDFDGGLKETFWFFRHEGQQLYRLDDGRMPKFCSMVAAVGDQFVAISSKSEKVGLLGPDFRFRDTPDAQTFFKFPTEVQGKITYVSPYRDDQLLLTLQHENEFYLVLFSMDKATQVISQLSPKIGGKVAWVYGDNTLFLFQGDVGKIQEVASDFSLGKVLAPAQEPIEEKYSAMMKTQGGSGYRAFMYTLIPHSDQVRFLYADYLDDQGKRLEKARVRTKMLQNKQLKTPVDERLIVGLGEKHNLIFDREERTLTWEVQPR